MFAASLTIWALLAQPTPPADAGADAFKAQFAEGEKLFAAGEFAAAVAKFKQADAIRETPEVSFDLAKCEEKRGDVPLSAYYYRQYLRRAPNAGDALEVAEILGDVLSKAEAEGRGLLEIESKLKFSVVVDGKSFAELPVALFLAPGDYDVVATLSGQPLSKTASILNGKVTTLTLEAPPPVVASAPTAPAEAVKTEASDARPVPTRAVLHGTSYALLGAGVLALAGGTVFGVMANGDVSKLSSERARMTASEGQALADGAGRKGATANTLFGVGAAAAVAGGLLFTFTLPEPAGGASP